MHNSQFKLLVTSRALWAFAASTVLGALFAHHILAARALHKHDATVASNFQCTCFACAETVCTGRLTAAGTFLTAFVAAFLVACSAHTKGYAFPTPVVGAGRTTSKVET